MEPCSVAVWSQGRALSHPPHCSLQLTLMKMSTRHYNALESLSLPLKTIFPPRGICSASVEINDYEREIRLRYVCPISEILPPVTILSLFTTIFVWISACFCQGTPPIEIRVSVYLRVSILRCVHCWSFSGGHTTPSAGPWRTERKVLEILIDMVP